MKKLLKLPLWIAALPMIILLLTFQLIGTILVGLSSIVTNLLATVFLIGSIAGSIIDAPSSMICQAVGIGVFFAGDKLCADYSGFPVALMHQGFLPALFLHSAEQYRASIRWA